MKKNELKALIKEAFLTEKESTLLNENAPGFDNRKQGGPLPTLESVKAAYQAKKLKETVETTEEVASQSNSSSLIGRMGNAETRVDSALEYLEQVVRNLAHTADMSEEEAAEMAIKHIQDTFEEADLDEAKDTEEETEATEKLTAAVRDLGSAKKDAGLEEEANEDRSAVKTLKEYGDSPSRSLDEIIDTLGYRQGFDEFIEDNPGCFEVITEWIGSIKDFREKLSEEYSNEELEGLGFYYGDDDELAEAKKLKETVITKADMIVESFKK